jgi:6-phosphogluconolactonase
VQKSASSIPVISASRRFLDGYEMPEENRIRPLRHISVSLVVRMRSAGASCRRTLIFALLSIALAFFATHAGSAQERPQLSKTQDAGVASTSASAKVVLYAGVGEELKEYAVDVEHGTLSELSSVALPGDIGEGWIKPSSKYLYVPWTNHARKASGLSAFRINSNSGALEPNGPSAPLPSSPTYVTGDIPGTHLLISYNHPSGITVHHVGPDGAIESEVKQSGSLDVGIFAHQVRVSPSKDVVLLVTRGNYTDAQYPDLDSPPGLQVLEPGALKVFSYKDGQLANLASIAPGGGFGFQSRHMDFHPSRPWIYFTLEPQNKLYVFKLLENGTPSPQPLFIKETLVDPGNIRPMQHAGTIHVHPSGKFVYVANRTNGTKDFEGQPVFAGGENSIAVYAINQDTGEPTRIQNIDTQGILPRTFAIDSSGRMLVVAHQTAFSVLDGNHIRTVPASLAVFQIRDDGKLNFVRKYDFPTEDKSMTWASPQGFTQGKIMSWVAFASLPSNTSSK